MTAMVAGTASWSRMICSSACAVSSSCGCGMPWAMMVDSSATTGRFSALAPVTSAAISNTISELLHGPLQLRGALCERLHAHLAADAFRRADREPGSGLAEQCGLQRPHPTHQTGDITRHMGIAAAGHVV